MKKVFVLRRNFGVAVVIAENAPKALWFLRQKEEGDGCPGYLSGNIGPDDFKEISLEEMPEGVCVYFAT
ncbi:MAG: hypothetical protein WC768_01955 [Patescibacteria group bacterium]|jgi:hypothetical protein